MTTPRVSTSTATLAAVTPRCTGVQRVELASADLARAREFYVDALGFPLLLDTQAKVVVLVGETPVAVHGSPATPPLGVERLVVGCEGDAELDRVAAALAGRGVETDGVRVDELFGRRRIAFRDPDGVRWELSET